MKHFIENCPMRQNVRRLCVGPGSRPFNHWDSSVPAGTPPDDIMVYVEWAINGTIFKLFKYQRGLNAMLIPGSESYMVFNEDIKKEFTLVQYFEDEYNKLIGYVLGD
jgi:hypothetical protein